MPLLFDSLKEALKDRPKSGSEVLSKLVSNLTQLETDRDRDKSWEKALENVSKYLVQLKIFLIADADSHEVTKDSVLALSREASRTNLLYLLVKHLGTLNFEARKDVAQVFSAIVRIRDDADGKAPGAQFVVAHPEMLEKLLQGYDEANTALVSGSMLRDCMRDETLAKMMLEGPLFLEFFDKIQLANFEVASDAFSTFKDLLMRHKGIVSQYLQEHYTEFFAAYMKLLQSSNYVTKRQSLKLLGELLLDRSSVKVMVRFVSEVQHLMQMMMMLKDQSRSIQFEAFHVFKVFVANPNKPQPIIDILTNNRDKLLKYLEEFHNEKDEDEQFKEEKAVLIREISTLGVQAVPAPMPPAASELDEGQ